MNFLYAFILSAVEGITEFLPISSTGHLILTSYLLQIKETDFVTTFQIVIQVGAIFAVVFLYWKEFIKGKEIWLRILAAFLPTAIVGYVLFKFIKTVLLGSVPTVLWSLFIGGIVLILLEMYIKKKELPIKKIEQMTYFQAFLVGVSQSFSVIPGVSRSGATIFGALLQGINRETAVEFSFLLAVPTMIAATGLDLVKSNFSFTTGEIMLLIFGVIVSFLTALAAVKLFVTYISKHTFIAFAVYRILLAVVFFLFFYR
ncbi:MAG TPA: undecaprenyl-diphosphate phosphatase [Patescibacteria group bacterium]|nr:undecaprenyl-diphosphate phosphatase [Patescibacteria group bacterium]